MKQRRETQTRIIVFLQSGFCVVWIKSSEGLWDPYFPFPIFHEKNIVGRDAQALSEGQDLMAKERGKLFQNYSPLGL